MEKLNKMLRQTEFHVFLVCFFANLFNWPFLAIPEKHGPVGMVIYLLLVWVVMIALLFFISRSFTKKQEGGDRSSKGGDTDV